MRSTKIAPLSLSISYFTGSESFGISTMTLIASGGFLPGETSFRLIALTPDADGLRGNRAFYAAPYCAASSAAAETGAAAGIHRFFQQIQRFAGCWQRVCCLHPPPPRAGGRGAGAPGTGHARHGALGRA